MAIDNRDPNQNVAGTMPHPAPPHANHTGERHSMADRTGQYGAGDAATRQEKRGARNAMPLVIGIVLAALAVMAFLSFGASNNDQMTTGSVNPAPQTAPRATPPAGGGSAPVVPARPTRPVRPRPRRRARHPLRRGNGIDHRDCGRRLAAAVHVHHHAAGSAVRPAAFSITCPAANSVSSSKGRPMSWRPSGSPF